MDDKILSLLFGILLLTIIPSRGTLGEEDVRDNKESDSGSGHSDTTETEDGDIQQQATTHVITTLKIKGPDTTPSPENVKLHPDNTEQSEKDETQDEDKGDTTEEKMSVDGKESKASDNEVGVTEQSKSVKDQSGERVQPETLPESESGLPDLTKPLVVEEPGDDLYKEGLEAYKVDRERAYKLWNEALSQGNSKAKTKVARACLHGDKNIVKINFTKAFTLFTELASKGIPSGQHGLGIMYSLGLGVNASQAKAMVYYTFAALGGDALAEMTMGYRHLSGVSVAPSCEAALSYYFRVATLVASDSALIPPAPVSKPRIFNVEQPQSSQSFDEDLHQYYILLADQGELQPQLALGQIYMNGLNDIPQDFGKALYRFKQAVQSGHAGSLSNIGKIYLQGDNSIKASNETAFKYFEKSVQKGDGNGYAGLSLMYYKGLGVKQDFVQAVKYAQEAVKRGSADGHLLMGLFHLDERVKQLSNPESLIHHFQTAAKAGVLLAHYYLGYLFAKGRGGIRSCPSAVEHFKVVVDGGEWTSLFKEAYEEHDNDEYDSSLMKYFALSELGYETAQSNAAYILETYKLQLIGEDLDNYRRALMLWKRSAGQGFSVARLKIGDYYYYGQGTEVDYEAAVNHYQIASEQLVPQAMFNLGYMHEQGLGLKKDYHLAKRLYDKAAEISNDADVPVALALFRLNTCYYIDQIGDILVWPRNVVISEKLVSLFGKNWDMYFITVLVLLVGLIYLIRQNR